MRYDDVVPLAAEPSTATVEPSADWRPLAPAARTVRVLAGAVAGMVLSIPCAAVLLSTLRPGLLVGLLVITATSLTLAVLAAWLGHLRWKRTHWKLDAIGLHVRRGVVWRTEVLIPRSRVQHLDIERGPIERHFAVATLVVHTAGTQTHALRQSGLADEDAVALRDALIPDATQHTDAL